ncbi:30S ribosomal protein S2 [Patescibacteria group bacterium]|nr:30S ribosomal protein S2 [Patescibacteria group bacterium]
MKEVALLDLLKNGVHFGHQKSRRHPKMEPYIFTVRNGVNIINLEKTLEQLNLAREFVCDTVMKGGAVLFVGTKRQAKEIVKKHAKAVGMPFITERWLGGLFTNFSNVSKLQKRLNKLEEQKESGELDKYTKKEKLNFTKEIEKLEKLVGGIKNMSVLPAAVFVVDIKDEKTAVKESIKKKIPLIAITDTNTNPSVINYPIPGNDDATKSLELLTGLIAGAVTEGKNMKEKGAVAEKEADAKEKSTSDESSKSGKQAEKK